MKVVYEDDTCIIYEENGNLRVVIKKTQDDYFKQLSREAKEFIKNYKR